MNHAAGSNTPQSTDPGLTALLNRHCNCVGTDTAELRAWLEKDLSNRGLAQPIVGTHPHLFSALPVFVEQDHALQMQRVVRAIEEVVALPAYRESVLAWAPRIAHKATAARGVFLGVDFHLTEAGPRLIEINTNAGGALLCATMSRAQRACCPEVRTYVGGQSGAEALEAAFFEMFVQEWRHARNAKPLVNLAIVDDEPTNQYLYPEFLLFQRLFAARDINAVIAAPNSIEHRAGALWFEDMRIDLLYNRLTDFYFEGEQYAALAESYASDSAVITPHPHAHALYASKRNLVLLCDERELRAMGATQEAIETLHQSVPRTVVVDEKDEERWWNERKQWFFKPTNGYGSRGSYRGDKLTRKVFAEMLRGDYVAQAFVPPSERWLTGAPEQTALKVDIRNYAYAGATQLMAARLYQGQTTNFRTAGGGFAPVYWMNDATKAMLSGGACAWR